MSKANKSSYKWLKSRSSAKKAKKREFNQRFNSTLEKLFPRTAPAEKKQSKNYDKLIQNLEDSYNKKLNQLSKNSEQALSSQQADNNQTVSALNKELASQKKQMSQLSKGVRDALARIEKAKQEEAKQKAAQTPQPIDNPEQNLLGDSQPLEMPDTQTIIDKAKSKALDEKNKNTEDKSETTTKTDAPVKEVEEVVADEVVKKTLALKDEVSIGDYSYRVTNLYGPRTGANAVIGREIGSHSRGVDLVSHDSEGNKVNYPVSISDGVIQSIRLQGSGKSRDTTTGKPVAGYMIDVVGPNGKMITYAHVSPEVVKYKDSLIGKQVKRGDVLLEDGGFSGTGSGSHVKVMMSDTDKNGKSLRNYTDEGNNPSNLILTGKYL